MDVPRIELNADSEELWGSTCKRELADVHPHQLLSVWSQPDCAVTHLKGRVDLRWHLHSVHGRNESDHLKRFWLGSGLGWGSVKLRVRLSLGSGHLVEAPCNLDLRVRCKKRQMACMQVWHSLLLTLTMSERNVSHIFSNMRRFGLHALATGSEQ